MRLGYGEGTPAAFNPPEEDPDSLLLGSRTAERLAQDHHAQATAAREGIAHAAHTWTGPRFETFMRSAAYAQIQLRTLADSCVAMSDVLARYARAVHRAADEIARCRSEYLRQLEIAADEHARAERAEQAHRELLTPHGLDTYGLGTSTTSPEAQDATERALAAERKAEALVEEAEDEHRHLKRLAGELLAEVAELNDRALPGSSRLSPQETARRVHLRSGLGHGSSAATAGSPALAALRLLDGVGRGIPVTAINEDGSVDWAALRDKHPVPKIGTEPVKVAAWWGGLADWQRDTLLRENPTLLGNLDGLPAWARDRANRASISQYRRELGVRLDELETRMANVSAAELRQGYFPEGYEIGLLQDKLDALARVEEVLARKGQRQLLVLDPFSGNQVHAAVAVGDVDAAEHLAVFTPGFKSNVQDKLGRYDDDMRALRILATELSDTLGDHGSIATVTWLGYDAPQADEVLDPGRSVAGASLAKKGGDALASFFTGINASRGDRPLHLTPLGHSYGSLTTAYALKHKHTGVDDAFMFGSPGLNVSRAGQLGLRPGHLMEAEASDDRIVADSGRFNTDTSSLPGIRRMRTDEAETPLGHTRTAHGHGGYLKEGTTSQYNIAVVVAGLDPRYQLTAGPDLPDRIDPPSAWVPGAGGPAR